MCCVCVRACVCMYEGKVAVRVEVMVRRGRKRKHVLDDIEETVGYWKLTG